MPHAEERPRRGPEAFGQPSPIGASALHALDEAYRWPGAHKGHRAPHGEALASRRQACKVGHRAMHGEASGLPPSGVWVGGREAGRGHPPVLASACTLLGHALAS